MIRGAPLRPEGKRKGARRFTLARGVMVLVPALALTGFVAPDLASRVGDEVAACLSGCASGAPRRPGPLRLVTLNMFHGFPHFRYLDARIDLIVRELEARDPDIVFLQEVPRTRRHGFAVEVLARRLDRNHVYVRANGNHDIIGFEEGVAILSRFPLRDAAFTELPDPGIFDHRVALVAVAETPWGALRLGTAHLRYAGPGGSNRAQLEALVEFAGERPGGPAVLAGDFNARDGAPHMRALADRWLDAQRAVDPRPSPTCCRRGKRLGEKHPGPLFARVDYVFLAPSDDWIVTASHPLFDAPFPHGDGVLWASNHTGVYVEARPGGTAWSALTPAMPGLLSGAPAPSGTSGR